MIYYRDVVHSLYNIPIIRQLLTKSFRKSTWYY